MNKCMILYEGRHRDFVCSTHQIIHLKRFQFFNGRWVKSQRMVQFPASNLEPLRYTVQNGNETASQNDAETQPSSSQSVENRDTTSAPSDTRPQVSDNTEIGTNTTVLANGGETPVINDARVPAGNSGARGREAGNSKQDQLDETLHRRKGTIYNLVAITVSVVCALRVWFVGSGFPSFLLFLCNYLSYVVCYIHVYNLYIHVYTHVFSYRSAELQISE